MPNSAAANAAAAVVNTKAINAGPEKKRIAVKKIDSEAV